jgi:CRP-like cAMP-binding protein
MAVWARRIRAAAAARARQAEQANRSKSSRTRRCGRWARESSSARLPLLREVPRTATVTARTGGMLYALDRDLFVTAVTGQGYSSRKVESVVTARLAAG